MVLTKTAAEKHMTRMSLAETLPKLITAHDKYQKMATKYQKEISKLKEAGTDNPIYSIMANMLDNVAAFASSQTVDLIKAGLLEDLTATSAVVTRNMATCRKFAGGHPTEDFKSWHEELTGEMSTWAMDDVLQCYTKNLSAGNANADNIERWIPVLEQVVSG